MRINALGNTATDFASDDYIAIDGTTNGSRKMKNDSLLKVTAQNALAGKVSPEFVPNSTKTIAGHPYVYNGLLYVAKVGGYQGVWDADKFVSGDSLLLSKIPPVEESVVNGADNTLQNFYTVVGSGWSFIQVRISPNPWPTSNITGTTPTIFRVYAVDSTGTETSLANYILGNSVPSVIGLKLPSGTRLLHFTMRADVGAAVSVNVKNADSDYFQPLQSLFEMGNIIMNSSSVSYTFSSTTRARKRQDVIPQFKARDTIVLDRGYVMYIAESANGEAPYTVAGWVSSYTFSADSKLVALLIRKSTETTSNVEELASAVHITRRNALSPNVSAYSSIDLENKRFYGSISGAMNGNGKSEVTYRFKCNPKTQVKISLDKTTWDVSSLGNTTKKFSIRWADSNGTFTDIVSANKLYPVLDSYVVTVPENAVMMDIFFRGEVGQTLGFTITNVAQRTNRVHDIVNFSKSANHRGYNSIAPENTLPAFKLSAQKGFVCVETDIWACADGTFVCIHDNSVDRTSDGSGKVTEMTLEELKALDFGSWKSAEYTGTKIPTLAEFLILCRNLGLHAYLELKGLENSSIANLVKEVRAYGMASNVTYISFTLQYLQQVVQEDKLARVSLLPTGGTITQSVVDSAVGLRTGYNEVFIDAGEGYVDSTSIALLKAAGMPVEIWTVDAYGIANADPYVSGFTSNTSIASEILFAKDIM